MQAPHGAAQSDASLHRPPHGATQVLLAEQTSHGGVQPVIGHVAPHNSGFTLLEYVHWALTQYGQDPVWHSLSAWHGSPHCDTHRNSDKSHVAQLVALPSVQSSLDPHVMPQLAVAMHTSERISHMLHPLPAQSDWCSQGPKHCPYDDTAKTAASTAKTKVEGIALSKLAYLVLGVGRP